MPQPDTSTRTAIIQAAMALFSSKGCAATAMRDIARAVGINVASIYHHFNGKRTLIEAVLREAEVRMGAFAPRAEDIAEAALRLPACDLAPLIWRPGRTDEDCRAARMVLMMQFESDEAAALARRMLIDAPRCAASAALSSLADAGLLPPLDCDMLAGMAAAYLCGAFTQALISNEPTAAIDRRCEDAARTMLALVAHAATKRGGSRESLTSEGSRQE